MSDTSGSCSINHGDDSFFFARFAVRKSARGRLFNKWRDIEIMEFRELAWVRLSYFMGVFGFFLVLAV